MQTNMKANEVELWMPLCPKVQLFHLLKQCSVIGTKLYSVKVKLLPASSRRWKHIHCQWTKTHSALKAARMRYINR